MAKKEEFAVDMHEHIGALPTVTSVAKYMGWSRQKTMRFLEDIQPVVGARRFYLDIVNKLMEGVHDETRGDSTLIESEGVQEAVLQGDALAEGNGS